MDSVNMEHFQNLLKENPGSFLSELLEDKAKVVTLLEDNSSRVVNMKLLLELLNIAFESTQTQQLANFFIQFYDDKFNMQLQKCLMLLLSDVSKDSIAFFKHLYSNLSYFQNTLPTKGTTFYLALSPILTLNLSKLREAFPDEIEELWNQFEIMGKEKLKMLENLSDKDVYKMNKQEKLHSYKPPNDYRNISIFPTEEDMKDLRPFIRPNVVKGKFHNEEHYLDVQFRLLREDLILPLREGISEYRKLTNELKATANYVQDLRVYHNVQIIKEASTISGIVHIVQFDIQPLKHINWETSKRLIYGSLVCLSSNNFETILFATVVEIKTEEIKHGICKIQFENLSEDILSDFLVQRYAMLESQAFFETYRHILKRLQEIIPETFPLKDYIVDVKNCTNPPVYVEDEKQFEFTTISTAFDSLKHRFRNKVELQSSTIFSLRSKDMDERNLRRVCLNYNAKEKVLSSHLSKVNILDEKEWPSKEDLGLDEAQYLALHGALTKEFSIIQGPPGTGKTFIGLKIVDFLLFNNIYPILIVCYTNHALDQFLEGIIQFSNSVIRFGGRSKNEQLAKYQISNLRYEKRDSPVKEAMREFKSVEADIERVKKEMQKVRTTFIEVEHFERYMLNHHYRQFQFMTFSQWLNTKNRPFSDNTNLKQKNEKKESAEDEFLRLVELPEEEADFQEYNYDFDVNTYIASKKMENNDFSLYIKHLIQLKKYMTRQQELKTFNIWKLPLQDKWKLFVLWIDRYLYERKIKLETLQFSHLELSEKLVELRNEEDIDFATKAQIIGFTTTGAAKNAHILNAIQPKVVIVEEAAEVLEAHILTSLNANIEQLILIGDHQQLRPSPTVYHLAKKFDLDVSLFERLINNGFPYHILEKQHRMRPCISKLLVPHIYPKLLNHESVELFENIKGMAKNMFFISHEHFEEDNADTKSYSNHYEAQYIFEICKYLLKQGYDPSQITILSAYTGQMFAIKKLLKDDQIFKGVRTTVIDNFQGEENEIILVSFVRSNPDEAMGFLKISNRVCVALSRARKGFYCLGNFELFAKCSPIWTQIVSYLEKENFIGKQLKLQCVNHKEIFTEITQPSDFKTIPESGCRLICNARLECGHSCTRYCHPDDRKHVRFRCQKPCQKQLKTCHDCHQNVEEIECQESCTKMQRCGHVCQNKCYENCGPCQIIVPKVLPLCQHIKDMPCHQNAKYFQCKENCAKILSCGHECKNKCYQRCGPCQIIVEKVIADCKHSINIVCSQSPSRHDCISLCEKVLDCGHSCKLKCSNTEAPISYYFKAKRFVCKCIELIPKQSPCNHMVNIKCNERLSMSNEQLLSYCNDSSDIVLSCGHTKTVKCRDRNKGNKCLEICEKEISCGHKIKLTCNDKSTLSDELLLKRCTVPCKQTLLCGHVCSGSCSKCSNQRHVFCESKCGRMLICGHACQKLCSEPCSPCKEKRCQYKCPHDICPKNCYEACSPCMQKCKWECEHYKCSKLCHEVCDRPPCDLDCTKKLDCGHGCMGYCGEPCPKLCGICNKNELEELFFGTEMDSNARFVSLEDCKHSFEAKGLKKWMNQKDFTNKIEIKTCPKCKAPIFQNYRFNDILKKCFREIEKFKAEYFNIQDKNDLKFELESTIIYISNRFHLDQKSEVVMKCFDSILLGETYEFIHKSHLVSLNLLANIFEDVLKLKIINLYEPYTHYLFSGFNECLEKLVKLFKDYQLKILNCIEDNVAKPFMDQIQMLTLEKTRLTLIVKTFYKLKDRKMTRFSIKDEINVLLDKLQEESPFELELSKEASDLFDSLFNLEESEEELEE